MRTLLWSYLGQRQFPREMSRFEIRHFFTMTESDRRELRIRFPKKVRLGAALQLGFLRMTGTTLAAMDYVPRPLFSHQNWACAYAGYRWPEIGADTDAVVQTLVEGTAVTLDPQRLAQLAREALVRRRCLIPRQRDIEDWVRAAVHRVEIEDRQRVEQAVSKAQRDSWLPQLLQERHPGPMTVLEWIRRPPRKRSAKTLEEEIAKWRTIRALAPPRGLDEIPAQRRREYARGGCASVDR